MLGQTYALIDTMANDVALMKGDIIGVKGPNGWHQDHVATLTWIVGVNFAATMAILIKPLV